MVFTYLDTFGQDKEMVAELKNAYRKGGLGDVKIKTILCDALEELLSPIRQKRQEISNHMVDEILLAGNLAAQKAAAQTLSQVKQAMGINYLR